MTAIVMGSPQAKAVIEADKALRRERRSEVQAVVICPRCKATITLEAETVAWELDEAADVWRHSEFGPATGHCAVCGIVFVDSWDGCRMLVPRQPKDTRR